MNVYVYKVPAEGYPRYSYTRKHAKTLFKRFSYTLNSLKINDIVAEPSFGDIKVFYLCEESAKPLRVEDICCEQSVKVEQELLTERHFANHFSPFANDKTNIFVAPYEYKEEADKFMGPLRLFIQKDRHDSQSSESEDNATTVKELAEKIAVLIERAVIDKLLERMGVLAYFMELKDGTKEIWQSEPTVGKSFESSPTKRLNRSMSLDSVSQFWMDNLKELVDEHLKRVPKSFQKIIAEFTLAKKGNAYFLEKNMLRDIGRLQSDPSMKRNDRDKVENLKSCFNTISDITQLKTKLERLKEQGDAIEQLYGEMKGMVYRSKLSKMPQDAIDMNPDLDEEAAKEMLSVDGVVRVGYRFRTLDIFLDDNITQEMRVNAEFNLQKILSKLGINRYAVHCNQKELTLFRQVGAKLTFRSKTGALGGFARRNDEMCVLLAKHVAEDNKSVYLQKPGGLTLLAHVLPPKVTIASSDIDIAIAKVVENEQSECDVRFKNEKGKGVPATLCTFNDREWLHGLPVHIWRADSRPGLGIISHPVLHKNGAPTKLVQIEDRQSEEENKINRFAELGDSGAIVCADDPARKTVHVIAMFIGSPNSSVAEQNPEIKQQYIAFRLVDGLDHLQHEQKASVTLYQVD